MAKEERAYVLRRLELFAGETGKASSEAAACRFVITH